MDTTRQTGDWKNWRWSLSRFAAAPLALKAFILFSVLAALYGVIVLLGRTFKLEAVISLSRATVPFTGGAGPMMYFFGLYFAFAILFLRDNKGVNRPGMLFGLLAPLIALVLGGIFQLIDTSAAVNNNSGNLYLAVSPWRPVWTIVLPLFWMVLLLSPPIKRFCKLPYQ